MYTLEYFTYHLRPYGYRYRYRPAPPRDLASPAHTDRGRAAEDEGTEVVTLPIAVTMVTGEKLTAVSLRVADDVLNSTTTPNRTAVTPDNGILIN